MKKYLQHFLVLISILFISTFSYAQTSTPFSKIVFFGDSLTDNGNLYNDLFGFLPKSPPYYQGRFSNGQAWSEYVDQYYLSKNSVQTVNYAVGGQTAILHNPFKGYLPYTITMSLDLYLLNTLFQDRSHTLYLIWIGANDYLPSIDNLGQLSSDVTNAVKATVESLIYHGGKNFIIMNLPDLSATPFAKSTTYQSGLRSATIVNNLKLDAAIADIQEGYKSVKIELFNSNQLLTDFTENIEKYNAKYNTHITNTTESCWQGGYTLTAQKKITEADIARQFEQAMRSKSYTGAGNSNKIDPATLAQYIAATPSLLETYSIGESKNATRCANPDEYLFWDRVHPTAVMHMMISKNIIEYIDQNYVPAQPAG